jgi:hypothetical protein
VLKLWLKQKEESAVSLQIQIHLCRIAYTEEVQNSFLCHTPPMQSGIILSDNKANHSQSAWLGLTHLLKLRLTVNESSAYRCVHFVWYIRRIRTAEDVVQIRTSVTPLATVSITPVDINRTPRSREYSNHMKQLWFANSKTNKVKQRCTL